MVTVRRFRAPDAPAVWALNDLPNIGATANPDVPLPLPPAAHPPATFPDLADIPTHFLTTGGEFLVAELDGHLVGMGGIRPTTTDTAHTALAGHLSGAPHLDPAGHHPGALLGPDGHHPGRTDAAHVLRVRVHPATRRRGVGRALMTALEERARDLGLRHMVLDTADNQPEAIAFYRRLGYRETGRERRPGWTWTLVYFTKRFD